MRTEFIYSFMALGAIPITVNAADVQQINSDVLASTDGSKVTYQVGKLVPGNYSFLAKLSSKVYGVQVKIGGQTANIEPVNNPSNPNVNIIFTLDEETDVELTLESTDPGESGAGFTVAGAVVSLDFDFAAIRGTLVDNAQDLVAIISGYSYAAKQEDVDAANALKQKAGNIADSYDDYKNFELYAEKSTIQKDIDQLAAAAAAKEAAYQNDEAYNDVNTVITSIKGKYNTAVATLEAELVDAAAYLLEDAKADLNTKINDKITVATQASYNSHEAGTAVADKDANLALIPTEVQINDIVANWTGQATTNKAAYAALHQKVTNLQTALDAIAPAEAIASQFEAEKAEAQAAIDAVNADVEAAKNSAAQLTLDVSAKETVAQTKIETLAGKVNIANAEYNANVQTGEAINALQVSLNAGKTLVDALKSADGKYEAKNYYDAYVQGIQGEIDQLTTDAAAAYEAGTAVAYHEALNTETIQNEINLYAGTTEPAVDGMPKQAVDKYNALQTAINGVDAEHPGYQGQLDAAREQVANLAIYNDPTYDYKTRFDLIQKRINDIKKAITAAQEKVGAEHWNAMLVINADADISTDIATLLASVQNDQNAYDKAYLDNGLNDLKTRTEAFDVAATVDNLGDDYLVFKNKGFEISQKYLQIKAEKEAVNPESPEAAATIQALGARITKLQAEQTALETAAAAVAAKVNANFSAQTTLGESITTLQGTINTFKTTYKIGTDESSLGNRGKAGGAITTEVSGIETALGTLSTANGEFHPWEVTNVDMKDKAGEWTIAGDVASQTISGLDNGLYNVTIHVTEPEEGAKVAVNGIETNVAAEGNFEFPNVLVSDGTLKLEITKAQGTVEVLQYRENDQLDAYNHVDTEVPEKDGLNVKYTKLATQVNDLVEAAPSIKAAVEANAATKTAANQAVTDLQTTELTTLKNLTNVTNAEAVNDDATALKEAPEGYEFKVFATGLDADKNYTAKKAAIDTDIQAMSNAIAASNANESLVEDWKDNSITVGEGDNKKTYSIATLTQTINDLKSEAAAESANWEAYKALVDNNWSKLQPDTITVSADDMGQDAVAYYQGLKDNYIAAKATILTNMQTDLIDRKAVSTKEAFETEIAALIEKVKVVKSDGIANFKKYKEQKDGEYGYVATQTLWNNTYTEIAATDHSSKRDEWLGQLDAIQATLTAATNAVETNYPLGKSVAEAKDFAAIQTAINDVKAQQQEAYVAQVAEDNKIAHESFMGTDTKKGAIQLATEAYQRAVAERAQYSSINEQIKAAVDAAAATLDEALFNCPSEIATLTQQENAEYTATVSPTVFDVSTYNQQATTITQGITLKLDEFKNAVKGAIDNNVWTPMKEEYNGKLTTAQNDIASYSDDAKKDAFKDVEDLIAKGTAGVASITLSEVETAIAGLEDIDDMLAADKDAAAAKDITTALSNADNKYTEVKTYINGVSDNIAAKNEQLQILEGAYSTVQADKELPKNFANHDQIVGDANTFITTANNCKTAVDNAVAADQANTDAYNEIIAAIAPLEDKLVEAKEAAAPYKYQTSFATEEGLIEQGKSLAEGYKEAGTAVAHKAYLLGLIEAHANDIEATLTTAFGNEKTDLATDISELKNQFNAYVAAKGLNETALQYQTDINNLETALTNAAIVEVDDPADGIKFNDILDATDKLIKLQNDIADKESELLEANASTANAEVLADFNNQIGEMEQTASLEGYAEWVAVQPYGNTTLGAAIESLKTQIADVKTAINAEKNIAFYKDQYQASIDKIKADLVPVAAAIAAKQAQFDTNAAAYTRLTNEINALQEKITLAKDKVEKGYIYAPFTYQSYIEQYGNPEDPTELTGGAQKTLNDAKGLIENWNGEKFLTEESEVPNKDNIESTVQLYLDRSAYRELIGQRNNLYTELANAIQYQEQTYSPVLWQRLIEKQGDINLDINALSSAIAYSYSIQEWSEEQQAYVPKTRTSDVDYAAQKAEVDRIQGEINDLHEVFENLDILGDANVDGRVNVLDYQKVLNMILDPTQQPEEDTNLFANIDINQSSVIEVGDLTAIVNYILNQDWQGHAAARSLGATHESLSMNMTSLENGIQRIAVNLQNANEYTAFQMDMVMPEGMKIVSTSLTNRAGESHKLYSRTQLDGSTRLLASSVKGESFGGNDGAVLYIDVEGAGSVELMNILFSDVNAQTRSFKLGDTTGIDNVSTFESLKQKVYDLGGRVKNGLQKGINIIRRADGTTTKVVK